MKIKGFLAEKSEDESLVVLVGESVHKYYLPNTLLEAAGVIAENQPFEIDGEVIRPLATPDQRERTRLEFDEGREEALRRLLSESNLPKGTFLA